MMLQPYYGMLGHCFTEWGKSICSNMKIYPIYILNEKKTSFIMWCVRVIFV